MRQIGLTEIQDIALGAAVYGTGGGGDPHVGMLMAMQAIEQNGPVTLLDADEVPDNALIVPSAMMGAPTVLVEKIPSGGEAIKAFEMLGKRLDRPVYATMPIEAGGVNSMLPFALAATCGLPIIDADGMGRAFPELQMVTFTLGGISATPMVLCDEKGNSVLFDTVSNLWTERLGRACTVQMGGSTMIALYPMSGQQMKASSILGIVSQTERVGRVIREAKHSQTDPVNAVLEACGGYRLFCGKVTDVARKTIGGFVRGNSRFDGLEQWRGQTLELEFQNEHLLARCNDKVICTTPDLIAVLDMDTGRPITTEGLRYGARGIVIAIPAAPQWRTPEGLKIVGPEYFGYQEPFIPVEQRLQQG